MGRRMTGWISMRLQEVHNNTKPFGGVHVILVGDTGQLPPIHDKPKFDRSPCVIAKDMAAAAHGREAYAHFTTVVHLTRAYRQAGGGEFHAQLQRIRNGEQTKPDWKVFCGRDLRNLPAHERERFVGDSAVRFCATLADAAEYNTRKLRELGAPIVVIRAKHSAVAASNLDPGTFRGLEKEVLLAVGARVFLRTNELVKKGLFNGALGWVRGFLYKTGQHPSNDEHPEAVVVELDDWVGPGFDGRARHVALPIKTFAADKKPWLCRSQIPLALAWATTIHKAQGMSCGVGQPNTHMVLMLGAKEFAAGLTFVGVSRAQDLQCLAFEPAPNWDRFAKAGTGMQVSNRKRHEEEQKLLAERTKEDFADLLVNRLGALFQQ